MRALILSDYEQAPAEGDFPEPEVTGDAEVVTLRAAGLNPFDVVYTSGRHPIGKPALPSVVGREGVGTTEDGRRVYFDATAGPFGSMGERALVEPDRQYAIPDGVSDEDAIALGATGFSAYLPLVERAELKPDDRVLILGATGAVGSIATQVAKLLGARRVVAAGRRPDGLQRALDGGADAVVDLSKPDFAEAMAAASEGGYDVVLDLLWGEPARAALTLCDVHARYLQVGSSAATAVEIPANPWRTRWVNILGYSGMRVSLESKRAAYAALLGYAAAGDLQLRIDRAEFSDPGAAWDRLVAGADGKLVVQFNGTDA